MPTAPAFNSSGERDHARLEASRLHAEKLVLACQIAGSRLDPDCNRSGLYEGSLHRFIQAAIDELVAQEQTTDICSIAERVESHPSGRADETLACLNALPVYVREPDKADDFDANFNQLVLYLKELVRRQAGALALVAANDIAPQAIHWLWDGWLARGKLHLLAGNVGAGKTTLALSLAAAISAGARLPDGSNAEAGSVLFWSGEDDPADSLVPRFLACGGNRDRLAFASGVKSADGGIVPFDPARDLLALARAIYSRNDLCLLIVDPIVSAVAGDSDSNTATRRALAPLVNLAARRNIAVLGIAHFGKTSQARATINRVRGSLSFTAMARLVMATAKGANGSRLLVRAKSNIGPDGDGFAYSLGLAEIAPGIMGQKIEWGEAVCGAADDLLAGTDENAPQRKAAEAWLAEQLGSEGMAVSDVVRLAREAGRAWRTVSRARDALGVVVQRTGPRSWHWSLNKNSVASDQRQHMTAETESKSIG